MLAGYDGCISATGCEESCTAPQCVEAAEVDCRTASCTECGGECTAPELAYWVWAVGDGADSAQERTGARLLHAGLEQIGGLEEYGREDA